MGHTVTTDPLAKTLGLVPRYVRERQAAEALERARQRAAPPPPPVVHEEFDAPPCEVATSSLRERIAVATSPRRTRLMIAAPAAAGLLLMLGMLLNN